VNAPSETTVLSDSESAPSLLPLLLDALDRLSSRALGRIKGRSAGRGAGFGEIAGETGTGRGFRTAGEGAAGTGCRTVAERRGGSKSGSFARLGVPLDAGLAVPLELRDRDAGGCCGLLPERGFPGSALDLLVGLPLRSGAAFLEPRRLHVGVIILVRSRNALISGGICTWCTMLTACQAAGGIEANSLCVTGGLQQPGQPRLVAFVAGSVRAN
jgi:hypothetical protein